VLQRVNWLFSEEYIFFQTANKKKIPILYVTCAISSLRVSSGSSVQRNVENKASIFVFPLPDKFFVQFVGVLFEKKKKIFFPVNVHHLPDKFFVRFVRVLSEKVHAVSVSVAQVPFPAICRA